DPAASVRAFTTRRSSDPKLKPDLIISALRADFDAQISAHFEAIDYVLTHDAQLVFLSSANVFDAFTNFPSYEYDKTFSYSIYGRFKIEIESALLRLPNETSAVLRLPKFTDD